MNGSRCNASICEFFREPHNRELIEGLRAAGLQFTHATRRPKAGPLAGKTVVLTGTMPTPSRGRCEEADRSSRRKGQRLGEQEDQLRGGWGRCGIEADQSKNSASKSGMKRGC
jgi:hypothetical protein